MNKRKKVIIFDGDDTLWRTQELYNLKKKQFKKLMKNQGFNDNNIIELIDQLDAERVEILKFSRTRFLESFLITYAFLCERYNKNWNINTEKIIRELGESVFAAPRLYDDTMETLETLSKHFNLFLFTVGDKKIQKKKIDSLGKKFKLYFSKIYIYAIKKEQQYRRIIRNLKIPVQDIWVIGNSIKSDINPCIKLGVRAILIPRGSWKYEESKLFPGDAFIANSLTDACNFIFKQENLLKQK